MLLFYYLCCIIKYLVNRSKIEEKLAGIHQAFKDSLNNLHMKSTLFPLFAIMDPLNKKGWPSGFQNFINDKATIDLEKSALAMKLRGTLGFGQKVGFGPANLPQLCFAEKILDRGYETKRVVNNFFNPNWTDYYGSGGNEEGHLLLLRYHYFKTEYCLCKADNNVKSFMRRIKKKPVLNSDYHVNVRSTDDEIEDEVYRKARQEAENYDPNWYPNQWLSFYLFGKPAHGTDSCFLTLTSGKDLKESTSAEMHKALADLNTEAANKSIRRKAGSTQKEVVMNETSIDKNVVVTHNFSRPTESKRSLQTSRLEKAFELLRGDDIQSDEETNFSKRAKKQQVGLKLLQNLLGPDEDDDE